MNQPVEPELGQGGVERGEAAEADSEEAAEAEREEPVEADPEEVVEADLEEATEADLEEAAEAERGGNGYFNDKVGKVQQRGTNKHSDNSKNFGFREVKR